MNPLEPPDSLHLEAAQGWLGLGNHTEAGAELEKISPGMKGHQDVLNVRWGICAAARQWEAALEIASAIIRLAPEDPLGWVHRSYALHELKRTAEARDNLLRIVDKHPDSPTIRYNLACYECQLGRLAWRKSGWKTLSTWATPGKYCSPPAKTWTSSPCGKTSGNGAFNGDLHLPPTLSYSRTTSGSPWRSRCRQHPASRRRSGQRRRMTPR